MANFFTKLASTVSIATLVAASTSASFVSAASEFLPYAEALADNGTISTQSAEAGYRLGANITRAELAKVVANLGEFTPTSCAGDVYSDVSSTLGDLCGYVEALAEAGVVSTANATYRPNANVTRAEAVKLILGALGETGSDVAAGYTDVAALGDLTSYINRANEIGVIGDATYFRPNASITRGEAFKIAAATAQLDVGTNPTTPTDTGSTTPTTSGSTTTGSVVAGDLSIALDGQAVAQYVPYNASNIKVGSVKLTAGKTDVSVNSLTVLRSGLGNSQGVTVSVALSGTVISENRTINSSTQEGIVRLNNTLVITAGTSVVVDVLASLDNTSGPNNQHQFAVKAVGTTATVTGTPVTLGLINTTSYSVSVVKAQTLTLNGVTSGKNDQSLGTIQFQAGNKDITLGSFILSKTSGVDLTRALANVKVYKNSVLLGTATVTSDKIYVSALALKIARNDTITLELRGDVTYVGAGGASEDIVMNFNDTTDVSATEDLTGYSTSSDVSAVKAQADSSRKIVLSPLDIVWTKNTTKSVTVAPGTTNVTLFDAKLTSSATFDVTSFTLTPQVNAPTVDNNVVNGSGVITQVGETGKFNSLTLTVNGVDYDLLNTSISAGVYTFSNTADKFRIDAGTPVNVKLSGNLTNSAPSGAMTYKVTLNTVKNLSNGNTVGVSNAITGDQVTVSAPELILKKSTVAAPTSTKIYGNATGLEIGRFGLEAKAEDVTLRDLTITNGVVAGGMNDFTKLVSGTNVKIVNVDTNAQASATVTVNDAATGSGGRSTIKLTGMSVKILKDTTSNFKLVVDTTGDLPATFSGVTGFDAKFDIVSTSVSSNATVLLTGDNTTALTSKVYSIGVVPPTVTFTKKTGNVFLVKVSNVDADTDIVLNSLTAQVRPVSVSNSTYSAITCVRDEGSSDKCTPTTNGSGTLVASSTMGLVPGAANEFVFSSPIAISKNSSVTREIFVDSNYVSPADLQGEITALKYQTSISETYSVVAQ